jgi:ankyrin repeat protein
MIKYSKRITFATTVLTLSFTISGMEKEDYKDYKDLSLSLQKINLGKQKYEKMSNISKKYDEELIQKKKMDKKVASIVLPGTVAYLTSIPGFTSYLNSLATQKNIYGVTRLHHAAYTGNTLLAKGLMDSGADVTAQDAIYNFTPFMVAAGNGHLDVVKLFHEKQKPILYKQGSQGEDWNLWNERYSFLFASMYGQLPVVKYLVEEADIDVNTQTSEGFSALMCAAGNNKPDVVTYLLTKNPNTKLKNKRDNKRAFKIAKQCGFIDIANLIKKHEENITTKENP